MYLLLTNEIDIMRKVVLIFGLITFLFSQNVFSQFGTLTPFKAKDAKAIKAARDQAVKDGIKNPRLLLVGSMSGTLPIQVSIDIKIDVEKGTASAWAYSFADQILDSMKTYAVVQIPFLGFMAVSVPASMITSQLPFQPTKSLDSTQWKPLESLTDSLNNNSRFVQFKKDRPDWKVQVVGVGVNSESPLFDMDKPYWLLSFNSGGGPLTCFIQAETGQTSCLGYWGVEDNLDANQFNVSPNPASTQAVINVPFSIQTPGSKLELYDDFGRKIKDLFAPQSQESDKVLLNTSGYSVGIYHLVLTTNGKTFTTKLIIQK